MKKILIIIFLLTGVIYSQTEVYIVRNKIDTLRIDVNDLKVGLGGSLIPPSDLFAIGDTNRYFLTWSDNSSNEEGFYISGSPDGVSWETAFTVPANTTSYTYPFPGNGMTRYFRISAYLGGLETSKATSEPAITLDLRDLTPPYLPYNVTAVGGDKKITITWADSSSDADMYYIYKSVTEVPVGLIAIDSISARKYGLSGGYTITGLGYNEIWYVRIKSRDLNYNYTDYSLSAFDTTDAQVIQDTSSSTNLPIFSVLFESNDLSEFTSTSGTNFNASTASKYSGSYGGEMYFDGVASTSYGIQTYSYPDTTYIAFRFKINSGVISALTFKYFTIAEFRTASNYALRFHIKTDGSGIPYAWGAYYNDSTGTTAYTSATNFSLNTWHLVEVKYKKNSSIGGAEIWIDSTKNTTLSKADRNTSANTITEIRFGSSYVSGTFSGGSIYLDNIYADTTRLGSTDTTTVIAPDVTPPNPPTNFTARGYYDAAADAAIVDLSWTDASSDEAKIYIFGGTKDVIGGNLVLLDSLNANSTTYHIEYASSDTLHTYEYGISVRDASYNYTSISSSQRDTAYIDGAGNVTPDPGTTEGDAYFVSLNGNGGNGKSWTNAWSCTSGWDSSASNPNGINWNIIQPGDTIYFDGGITSMDYTSKGTFYPRKNGTYTNYVYLAKGTSAGRNGVVLISNVSGLTSAHCIEFNGWTVTGFWSHEITNGYTVNGYHLRFKNIRTVDAGTTQDKFFNFTGHPRYFEFINCWLKQSSAATSQSDLIWIRGNTDYSGGGAYADSIFIIGCTLISDNQAASPHSDGFQYVGVANVWTEGCKFYTGNNKVSYTQTWYGNGYTGKAWFLNNIFYISTSSVSAAMYINPVYVVAGDIDSLYWVDNTVVADLSSPHDRAPWFYNGSGSDSYKYVIKNNIAVGSGVASGVGRFEDPGTLVMQYNQWYNAPKTTLVYYNGAYRDFAYLQGLDANAINTQPTFTNFDWTFSRSYSTYGSYDFNVPSPANGTAFTTSFSGHTYTSDGKIGALVP